MKMPFSIALPPSLSLFTAAAKEWRADKVPTLGAALSYYTIFSIAPLVVIAVGIAGLVFGRDRASEELIHTLGQLAGTPGAEAARTMIENAGRRQAGVLATTIGGITLLVGASGVFAQLQDTLNAIWKVEPRPELGIKAFIRQRLLSFGMVLGVGFLLMVSLIATAALSAMGRFMSSNLPGGEVLWQAINFAISFAVIAGLFALIFKMVPDVRLRWRDVTGGAILTAALFTIGKFLIGIYIGRGAVGSVYGAAGSFLALLLWVYYSSQIVFFGAEFTKGRAIQTGARVEPDSYATVREKALPGESGETKVNKKLVERMKPVVARRERRRRAERGAHPKPPKPLRGLGGPTNPPPPPEARD